MTLEHAVAALSGTVVPVPDISVQFMIGQTHPDGWLRSAGGHVSTGAGRLDQSTLQISCSSGRRVAELLAGPPPGVGEARQVSVRITGGDWALHPPFDVDVTKQPLPTIPCADVVVRHITRDSILGVLDFADVFKDGRLVARIPSGEAAIDVTARHTFRQLTLAYNPAIDSLTAVTGMRVDGRHRALIMVAAGLYDDRRLRSFLFERAHENTALADMADVLRVVRDASGSVPE